MPADKKTLTGIIKFFDESRGYGFIAMGGGQRELFVHISAVADECDYPRVGDRVSFTEDLDRNGRRGAADVMVIR